MHLIIKKLQQAEETLNQGKCLIEKADAIEEGAPKRLSR